MNDADLAAQRNLDLKQVMDSDFGRRVIWRVLIESGAFASVTRECDDRAIPFESRVMYNAGRQDLANWLIRKVQVANPVGYRRMHEEAEGRFLEGKQNG